MKKRPAAKRAASKRRARRIRAQIAPAPAAPALPEPLTPPDCDLTGLRSMMVDVGRVLDSDLFALASGEEFKASFALWCKAWSQTPAGSIPADERVLARFAGVSLAEWRGLAGMALRGWIRCSDGRWYHPVVCEKVLAAWIEKLRHRRRSAVGNARRHGNPLELDPFDQAIARALEHLHALDPALAAEQARRRAETPDPLPEGAQTPPARTRKRSEGRGKGISPQPPSPGGKPSIFSDRHSRSGASPGDAQTREPSSSPRQRCGPAEGRASGFQQDSLPPACARGAGVLRGDRPIVVDPMPAHRPAAHHPRVSGRFASSAPRMTEREGEGEGAVPTEAQWRPRLTEWTRNRFWNDTDWGPRPTDPNCQAPPELLAELPSSPLPRAGEGDRPKGGGEGAPSPPPTSPPSRSEGGGPPKAVEGAREARRSLSPRPKHPE